MSSSKRRPPGSALLLVGGLLLSLAACGGASGTPKTPPSADPEPSSFPAVEEGDDFRIVVHEPGVEPRRRLRLRIPEGQVEGLAMTVTQSSETTVAGRAVPAQPDQVMEVEMRIGPTEHLPENRYRAPMAYTNLQMPTADTPGLAEVLEPLKGIQGEVSFTDQGEILDSRLDIPGTLPAPLVELVKSLEQGLRQAVMRLPTVALGVGARWEHEARIANPLRLTQTVDVRLIGFEDDGRVLVLEGTVSQRGEPGATTMPMSPPVEIERLVGDGRFRNRVPLDRLANTSEVDVTVDLRGTVDAGGQALPMHVVTRVRTRMAPIDASAAPAQPAEPAAD